MEQELRRARPGKRIYRAPGIDSIHLIQRGILRLMQLFPTRGIHQADIDECNRQTLDEIAFIRNFIVLHYKVAERQDSPGVQEPERVARGDFLD